jgi:hypothetical protein
MIACLGYLNWKQYLTAVMFNSLELHKWKNKTDCNLELPTLLYFKIVFTFSNIIS